MVTATVNVPRTWWQHLKHQYMPAWLTKWFPITYEVHSFSVDRPSFKPPQLMVKSK